ncbi:hypothetical protein EV363DRAFT_1339466, partial [Boletus edulis]
MTRTMFLITMTGLPISVAAMWTMTITMTELPMSATTNLHRSSSLVSSLSLSDPSPLLPRPIPVPSDKDLSTPWADLAQVYNDIAEAHERAARKAKRDAYRSRSKALAIL